MIDIKSCKYIEGSDKILCGKIYHYIVLFIQLQYFFNRHDIMLKHLRQTPEIFITCVLYNNYYSVFLQYRTQIGENMHNSRQNK